MRIATAVLITTAALAASANESPSAEPTPSRTATRALPHINLDAPGVLEAIAEADPDRYQRIIEALDRANVPDCQTQLQLRKAQGRLDALECSNMSYLASFPPKRRVTFWMNDAVYSSNVVQDRLDEAKLRKAQNR